MAVAEKVDAILPKGELNRLRPLLSLATKRYVHQGTRGGVMTASTHHAGCKSLPVMLFLKKERDNGKSNVVTAHGWQD